MNLKRMRVKFLLFAGPEFDGPITPAHKEHLSARQRKHTFDIRKGKAGCRGFPETSHRPLLDPLRARYEQRLIVRRECQSLNEIRSVKLSDSGGPCGEVLQNDLREVGKYKPLALVTE